MTIAKTRFLERPLLVIQEKLTARSYKLIFQDEVVSTLNFGNTGSSAVIEQGGKKWELKSLRFWTRKFGIFKYGYELPSAEYYGKKLGSGYIKLPEGIVLRFVYHIWRNTTDVYYKRQKLISAGRAGGVKAKLKIFLVSESEIISSYPWLIMFVAYLSLLRKAA